MVLCSHQTLAFLDSILRRVMFVLMRSQYDDLHYEGWIGSSKFIQKVSSIQVNLSQGKIPTSFPLFEGYPDASVYLVVHLLEFDI